MDNQYLVIAWVKQFKYILSGFFFPKNMIKGSIFFKNRIFYFFVEHVTKNVWTPSIYL